MMKTIVYIDGFNLYYRALKSTAHKWLNIAALAHAVLPNDCELSSIKYYTARISGRTDPTAPARQHAYLRAIGSLPGVTIYYGNFLTQKKWAGLVLPPTFRPECTLRSGDDPQVAYVWKTEEKGSDVNLGVHLVRDAYMNAFEQAAVLTNDTDLIEPIRIVTQELSKKVILLTPVAQPATSLAAVASHIRHIKPYIGPCALPDTVQLANGTVARKPASW